MFFTSSHPLADQRRVDLRCCYNSPALLFFNITPICTHTRYKRPQPRPCRNKSTLSIVIFDCDNAFRQPAFRNSRAIADGRMSESAEGTVFAAKVNFGERPDREFFFEVEAVGADLCKADFAGRAELFGGQELCFNSLLVSQRFDIASCSYNQGQRVSASYWDQLSCLQNLLNHSHHESQSEKCLQRG